MRNKFLISLANRKLEKLGYIKDHETTYHISYKKYDPATGLVHRIDFMHNPDKDPFISLYGKSVVLNQKEINAFLIMIKGLGKGK